MVNVRLHEFGEMQQAPLLPDALLAPQAACQQIKSQLSHHITMQIKHWDVRTDSIPSGI